MQFAHVAVARDGPVATVTLNRPEVLNALSFSLRTELDQAITGLEQDDDVRAVVVTGAGDRAFSAGGDIHEMAALSEEEADRRRETEAGHFWHLATCKKPTLGAINGLAYGGGALLASCLDLRVGCERSRFRFLAAAYGRLNSTWVLPLIVGLPRAKELLFTGREVDAREALEMGLLNLMVPTGQLMERAMEMARLIASNHPRMVQGIKELLHRDIGRLMHEQWRSEQEALGGHLKVVPPQEGFRDFLARKGKE